MELSRTVTAPIKLKGRYRITTRNTTTGERVEDKCFDQINTVTREGKHYFFSKDYIRGEGYHHKFNDELSIGFGTGTAEILETDIAFSGSSVTKGTSTVTTTPEEVAGATREVKIKVERKAVFSPGQATGTFGQVGLLRGSVLLAGQVLRNTQGEPTTVTFLDIEEVTVHYVVEIQCRYGVGGLGEDALIPAGSETVVINGTNHEISILAIPCWVGTNYSQNVINNPTANIQTFYNFSSSSWMNFNYLTASAIDSPEADWVYMNHRISDNNIFTISVLEKGKRYKLSYQITLPYTKIQDVFISKMTALGAYATINHIADRLNGSLGVVNIDPPIFKAAGDELVINFHVIYELP